MPDRESSASAGCGPTVGPDPRAVAAEHRLLIVDDDPGFRAIARELLDGEVFQVVGEAADGSQCLEQIRSLRPGVVLLDVRLPDANGFQVCRAIAGADTGAEISVVLCSVREVADYGPAVGRCGARAFVSKADLSVEALIRALDG